MTSASFVGTLLLGMFSWPLVVKPTIRWAMTPRRPINEFCGKIFPHQLDDKWKVHVNGQYDVVNGPVLVRWVGTNVGIQIDGNDLMLSANEINRALRYGQTIYNEIVRRAREAKHAKALEVMEEKRDQVAGLDG